MLTFLSINIEGFRSIAEQTHLQLNTPGITWINSPTGSGKSTIFSAITWCLYGKDLKGVSEVRTWEKLRPKNYQGVCVTINYQTSKGVFKVTRCQDYKLPLEDGSKGGNRLIMYQDAYPLDVKGKTKIQSEIEKSVGLTYQLFINSIMFGQGLKRLIQESNTDKKKLFEEVFDLNFLNLAKGVANDERRDILVEANEIENKANQLKHQVEESKNTYFELRERERSWKATIHRQRRELRERRTELTRRLQETQRELKDSVEATLDSKISRTESRLNSVSQRLKKAKGDTQLDLEDFVTEILKMLKSKKYQLAYKKLQTLHATFKEITECQEEKEQLTQRKYKLKEIKTRYAHINKTCNTLADNICEIDEQIRELENEKQKVLSPKYKKAWENYRKKLKKADEDYHNKLGELENYDWLITEPLGNNGIKAYLFDSSLDLLNHVLESYSEILGFRVSFEVDLDSARKEFVTLIESNGIIIEYDELSGGEKSLVNLAMALAMNEALTAARGINLAFLDEVFEGISDDVLEVAINLITKVFENKNLFLISHHQSLPLHKARIMQVVKHDGLSKVLYT